MLLTLTDTSQRCSYSGSRLLVLLPFLSSLLGTLLNQSCLGLLGLKLLLWHFGSNLRGFRLLSLLLLVLFLLRFTWLLRRCSSLPHSFLDCLGLLFPLWLLSLFSHRRRLDSLNLFLNRLTLLLLPGVAWFLGRWCRLNGFDLSA